MHRFLFLMFWIGSFWREDLQDKPFGNMPPQAATEPSAPFNHLLIASAAAIACMGFWPSYSHYVEQAGSNPTAVDLTAFNPAWQEAHPFTTWHPHLSPAKTELHRYLRNGEQTVGVSVFYYRDQQPGSVLISSTNTMVSHHDQQWRVVGEAKRVEAGWFGRVCGGAVG